MRWLAITVMLAGCGRLHFDELGFDERDGGITGGDTIIGNGDASVGDGDSNAGANRAFVTSTTTAGDVNGVMGADAKCMADAVSAGLTGTYIALVSTSAVHARDRVIGSSGWIRADGAPLVNTIAELSAGHLMNPLLVDADGQPITPLGTVWTGSQSNGSFSQSCADWSATNGTGQVGHTQHASSFFSSASQACSTPSRFYCFEVGNNVVVRPVVGAGRFAFISSGPYSGQGLLGLDGMCASDAVAAGLTGTFLAAVATTTRSIAGRFTLDARPWQRPDGTIVSNGGTALFDQSPRRSFMHQSASGAYAPSTKIFTGAADPFALGTETCSDWTASNATFSPVGDSRSLDGSVVWSQLPFTCQTALPVLCLEE